MNDLDTAPPEHPISPSGDRPIRRWSADPFTVGDEPSPADKLTPEGKSVKSQISAIRVTGGEVRVSRSELDREEVVQCQFGDLGGINLVYLFVGERCDVPGVFNNHRDPPSNRL